MQDPGKRTDLLIWAIVCLVVGLALLEPIFFPPEPCYAAGLIQVRGWSMEPALHNGGLYVVLAVPYSTLKKRDVVEYRIDFIHESVAHRIVAGWPGKWVAKGDANVYADRGYVTSKNFIGRILIP